MYAELFQFPANRDGYDSDFGGALIPEVLHKTTRELTDAFHIQSLRTYTQLAPGLPGVTWIQKRGVYVQS